MMRLNNTEKYLLQFAEFLKKLSNKINLYVSKRHFPKYGRGAYLSLNEYVGDKKMYKITNKKKRIKAKNYE